MTIWFRYEQILWNFLNNYVRIQITSFQCVLWKICEYVWMENNQTLAIPMQRWYVRLNISLFVLWHLIKIQIEAIDLWLNQFV